MKVDVKLFAVARELAGCDRVTVELADCANVADLRNGLAIAIPGLAPLLPQIMFAVNSDYASDTTPIPPGADIACIPPVSGG